MNSTLNNPQSAPGAPALRTRDSGLTKSPPVLRTSAAPETSGRIVDPGQVKTSVPIPVSEGQALRGPNDEPNN